MVDTMVVLLWIHVIEIFFTLDHSTQGRSQDCEVNGARIRLLKQEVCQDYSYCLASCRKGIEQGAK